MSEKMLVCSGVRSTGHWKGYQCGATPKYEVEGKSYCANHAVLALQAALAAETKRREEAERDYALTSAELQVVQEENLKLRAENERMREALEKINLMDTYSEKSYERFAGVARAAIAKPEGAPK